MLRRLATFLSAILFVVVLATIWYPPLSKYWVWQTGVDASRLEKLRASPDDARLAELIRLSSGILTPFSVDSAPEAGARLLAGDFTVARDASQTLSSRFSAGQVLGVHGALELSVNGMAIPHLLLRAYAETHDARFLSAAAAYARDWADFERGFYLPHGLFWNDHAIASRAMVLTELWFRYRSLPVAEQDPEVARGILGLVGRYATLLARDTLYTYRSNHGSMQNLALLILALAFPELDDAPRWAETGYRRFLEQIHYYLAPDGVITEHSPGYQAFGIELLGATLRCLTLLGKEIPPTLDEHYEQAKIVYAQLERPDGTLPTFGDTAVRADRPMATTRAANGGYGPLARLGLERPHASTISTNGGLAIWWDGTGTWPDDPSYSQLVASWANFPSRVHKHADEMSIELWAAGRSWFGNVGYWPYHLWGREHSEGWEGSNAPHLAGEPPNSARKTEPLLHARDRNLVFFEMRRTTPDGFAARRQLVRYAPGLLLVIDSFEDGRRREVQTLWSLGESVAAQSRGPGSYQLAANGAQPMDLFVGGSTGHRVDELNGSREPFGGWRVDVTRSVVPVPALLVRQESNRQWSWMALAPTNGERSVPASAAMESWNGPDEWHFRVDAGGKGMTVSRSGRTIRVGDGTATASAVAAAVESPRFRPAMEDAYRKVAAAAPSPWYNDLIFYRWRATYLVAGLAVAQLLVVVVAARILPRLSGVLAGLAVLGWIATGLWLNLVYFPN